MLRSLLTTAALLFGFGTTHAQCPATVTPSSNYVCVNQIFTLTASSGANSYQWFLNGNPITGSTNILSTSNSVAGTQMYTAIIDFGNCIDTVDVQMTILSLPVVTASNNNPTCGSTLILTATNCTGCTYQWAGPNNFTSTFQNAYIPNALPWNNGVYTLVAVLGGCASIPATTTVNITAPIPVIASNSGYACIGDTLHLEASTILGATYQWYGPGNFVSYQEDTFIVVDNNTQGGAYSVYASQGACPSTDTTFATICNTIQLNLYNDLNNDCFFDTSDAQPFFPCKVEIDSNGVILDTISATSGFYYTANGVPGDIYSFKIVSLGGGFQPTCPVTGIIDHTLQLGAYDILDMGIACITSGNFDLAIYASNPTSTAISQSGYIYASNMHCYASNGVVTLTHSPKYQHSWSSPPATVAGNTLTWNLSNLSANNYPVSLYYNLAYSTTPLLANDTTYSYFSITPTTGDNNPANNTWTKHDTVIASQDPNAIMAFPEGCIEAGDKLQYTIMFENIGNAPAENIYVLDTLPAELDANTLELVMSSHNMYVSKTEVNGSTIFKFNFPDINLPDSSDHAGCHGMLVYTIDSKNTLPYGAAIDHRAGIYFDYNSVVMTNTYSTLICTPNNVTVAGRNNAIKLYPNPAGDELTLQTDSDFNHCTISNSIGQVMQTQNLDAKMNKLDIHALAPGIYYINIKGEGTQEVLKFVKQ